MIEDHYGNRVNILDNEESELVAGRRAFLAGPGVRGGIAGATPSLLDLQDGVSELLGEAIVPAGRFASR